MVKKQYFELRTKSNKGGNFIGLLVRSQDFTAGKMYVCIPKEVDGRG